MEYLLLVSSIALGALAVFALKLYQPHHVKLLNAFTGAFLLSMTFLHILPEVYHSTRAISRHDEILVGCLILAGFFVQVGLEAISMGVEHGHAHPIHGSLPVGILGGLCIHALVEAMALGNAKTHFDPASRQMLLLSIVLHNFPVSIALLGMLLQSGMRTPRALAWLGVFAAMGPLGMFLSAHTGLAAFSRQLTAFVIGIFLHISTTILFESSEIHRFNLAKLFAIIVGTALGILSVFAH